MKIMTKSRAFLLHLAISLVVFSALLAIILLVWFPSGLIYAGGITGLKLIIGVDIVLGPLLTWVVFKPGKPGLTFDLSVIASLQIICLVLGTWVVYKERPMALVLMHNGLHFISYADTTQHDLGLDQYSGDYPKKIIMDLPDDISTWSAIVSMTEFADGIPFLFRSDLYRSFSEVSSEEFKSRLAKIQQHSPTEKGKLKALEVMNSCEWVPVTSLHTTGFACIDQVDGIHRLSNRALW